MTQPTAEPLHEPTWTHDPEPEVRVWPDGFYWHQITIVSQHIAFGAKPCELSTEGPPSVIAAYLRAVADQIDPPPSPARVADALVKALA